MEWHVLSKLSRHMDETAEGYLICRDVPIARTGTQIYWENEVPPLQGDAGGRVHVDREASEVFHPDSVRSFEGKPLVDNHPFDPVGPDNWNDLAVGYVANPRRGTGVHDDLLFADLVFTSRRGIDAVRRGKRAISVGYNAFYEQTAPGLGRQKSIFCNHVALVDEGRCGARCTIMDGRSVYNYDAEEQPRVPEGSSEGGQWTSGGGGGGSKGKAAPHLAASTVNGKHMTAEGGELPDHIKAAKIPPGWSNVTYSPDPKAELLATGKDTKGRRQPIYSAEHHARKGAEKFARVKALEEKFDAIHKKNEQARRSSNPATAAAADVTALIMHTGMRPGSETDTGATEKAYGATTLEGRHVVQTPEGLKLQFVPGKKHGQQIEMPVDDPDIAKMLLRRQKEAGPDGQLFGVNEKALLNHVHSLDKSFKTKDFRTHLGTKTALAAMKDVPEPTNEKEYKRAAKHVATIVSEKLGNTPAIAMASYISPVIWANWRQHAGMTADAAFQDEEELPDAHWGEVGAELPAVQEPGDDEPDDDGEDITEADPDVIAMIGFDPFEDEDEDRENIDYDDSVNIDYQDFEESKIKRVPSGSSEGGQFGAGGGGTKSGGSGEGGSREGRYPTSKGEHGLVGKAVKHGVKTAKGFGKEDYEVLKEHMKEVPPEMRAKLSHFAKATARAIPRLLAGHWKEEKHNAIHAAGAVRALTSGKRPTPEQMKGLRAIGTRAILTTASVAMGDVTGGGAAHVAAHFGNELVQHVVVEHALKAVVGGGRAAVGGAKRLFGASKDAEGEGPEKPEPMNEEISSEDMKLLQQFIEAIGEAMGDLDAHDLAEYVQDDWNEQAHPRDPKGAATGGQFTSGGGGASAKVSTAPGGVAKPGYKSTGAYEAYKQGLKSGGGEGAKPGGEGAKPASGGEGAKPVSITSTTQHRLNEYAEKVPDATANAVRTGAPGKLLKAMARDELSKGTHPATVIAQIQAVSARYTDKSVAAYANVLIKHIAEAHNVNHADFGKAGSRPLATEGKKPGTKPGEAGKGEKPGEAGKGEKPGEAGAGEYPPKEGEEAKQEGEKARQEAEKAKAEAEKAKGQQAQKPPAPKTYEEVLDIRAKEGRHFGFMELQHHRTAWKNASPQLLAVMANISPLNSVRHNDGETAHYRSGDHSINMNDTPMGGPKGDNVWRHEYGHAIDYSFTPAKTGAQWYHSASSIRANSDRELESIALQKSVKEGASKKITLFNFRSAITAEDSPSDYFLREAEGLPVTAQEILNYAGGEQLVAAGVIALLKGDKSWLPALLPVDVDNAMDRRMFEDFVGSMTMNKVMQGHGDDYYRERGGGASCTEMFANYICCTNARNGPVYRAIFHAIAPRCCKHFDDIIAEKTEPAGAAKPPPTGKVERKRTPRRPYSDGAIHIHRGQIWS